MGRCSWKVTKGKKKGEVCEIYTGKKYNGKYYCTSHYKMISGTPDSSNSPEEKKKKPKNEVIDKSDLDEVEELTEEEESENENNFVKEKNKIIEQKEPIQKKKNEKKYLLEKKIDYVINRFNEIFPPKSYFDDLVEQYKNDQKNNDQKNEIPSMESWK